MKILVVDIGGTNVKCLATGQETPVRFKSGRKLTPERMVSQILEVTEAWRFVAVSLGYPGAVRRGAIEREPVNLAPGWVGFDFQAAFQRPVKIINDAAMQALGAYTGGTMLFLGLGTGLGSTFIIDGVIAAMELGHLPYAGGRSYEDVVGERGRKRLGNKKWRDRVNDVAEKFRKALLPEYLVLGGGNARRLKKLPPDTHRGDNACAFTGGFRLWEQQDATGAVAERKPPALASDG